MEYRDSPRSVLLTRSGSLVPPMELLECRLLFQASWPSSQSDCSSESLHFFDFDEGSYLQLNGSARVTSASDPNPNQLQLTDAINGEAGSAFTPSLHPIGTFVVDFDFQISDSNG